MKKAFSISCGIITSLVFGLFFVGCANHSKSETKPTVSPNVKYEITVSENGYGYKIYMDENLYISQPNIPAMSGTAGFQSEADARKIAELAVSKIKQGIMPPTITTEEIKDNGITIQP
jgi:hypothetical protein